MCAVSQVGDIWTDRFKQSGYPSFPPMTTPENNTSFRLGQLENRYEALRKEVEQMKAELLQARKQDIKNGEPDCEMEDKVKLLKQIAELVGVDLKEVFPGE